MTETDSKLPIGAIGEATVVAELLWNGWSPVNINSFVSQAPNIDLLAAKGHQKVAIQVKASGPKSKSMLQVGYTKGREKVFNSKEGPQADFIVFVRLFKARDHECYIVPVAEAERAARQGIENWGNTPKRDGTARATNFPACIRFEPNKNRPNVSNYKEKWAKYRDAWHLLEEKL